MRFRIRSVTSRWVLTILGVILLILIVANIVFAINIKNYFYNEAEQSLISNATSDFQSIQLYQADMSKNINNEIRSMVQNAGNKSQIEVMSLNFSGQVTYTSSGFEAQGQNNPTDYQLALSSPNSTGKYVGYLADGEHVMAYTQLVSATNNEFSALRYMVSLKKIDNAILSVILISVGFSAVLLIFVIISGFFFIKSIVIPVREINGVVSKIASGDLSAKINIRSNDELGRLCNTINFMADELSNSERIKNEFISSVSHELRTPLTAIQGWSETVLSVGSEDGETVKKGMEVINKETERLSGMVEELLDFSKIQSGRFKMMMGRMDLYAELEEVVLIYSEAAKREGKTFRFEEKNVPIIINGDKNRIRQVFINVVDNALKYSDPGDTITVAVFSDSDRVTVKVSDTGCGIAREDIDKITQKFYKANNTRRGSGIGLAVAKEIVSMHSGDLNIQSIEGEGTTVTISFPIFKEEETNKNNI